MTFWTRLGAVLLVSVCPALLFADAVSTSSSCTLTNYDFGVSPPTTNVASQVNPSGGCGVTLADPFSTFEGNAYARANAVLYLPVAGSPSTPVGAKINGDIGVFPASVSATVNATGTAQFSIAVDLLFSTPGPARNGFISLSYVNDNGNGADGPSIQRSFVSIGDLSTNHGLNFVGKAGTPPPMPFALGQNFSFHEDLSMQAFAFPQFGILESANPEFSWTFTLFEADGVTPVQVSLATPEPDSLMLWASGLLALLTLIPRSLHRGE